MIQRRQIEYSEPIPHLSSQQMRDKLMTEIVQFAMNFANDSFQTSLCIQYPAENIAKSCVFLAGQFSKTTAEWFSVLEIVDVESFASICVQLLELVSEKKGVDEASFRSMRSEVEKLRNSKPKELIGNESSSGSEPASKRSRV
jgi:hypothetical protein